MTLIRKLGLAPVGPGTTTFAGLTIHYGDFEMMYGLLKEIFILRIYAFETDKPNPRIIDAGGNIGLATLFFKYQYPGATVITFEPDASNFELLSRNVTDNHLANVELQNFALLDRDGETSFFVQTDIAAGDGGASTIEDYRYEFHKRENIREVRVKCRTLSPFLAEPVDMLKMDIEGSEERVFAEIDDKFGAVAAMNMEYHYIAGTNPLSTILAALERAGHRYHLVNHRREDLTANAKYNALPKTYELIIKSARGQ
ncbi:FkbM family methyltransferase [bacterium]|nr:FkbM family methyltransferase [bacterium]